MDKRITPLIVLMILAMVLESAVSMWFFSDGGIGDSLVTGLNLMQMKLDNPAEYAAEFDGYREHTYYSETGSGATYKRAVYIYKTEDGEQRSAESNLTDAERGSRLPQTVRVLDDGRNAFIKNDFDDMKRIAHRGLIKLGVIAGIPVLAVIIGIIIVKIRRKKAAQAEW